MERKQTKRIDRYIYFPQQILGKGQFGKVYKGQIEKTGDPVAVKQIDKSTIQSDPYLQKGLFSEITVMKKLKSPNIVELIDVLETSNNFYIIQEFCDSGDFSKFLQKKNKVPEAEAVEVMSQILNGFYELFKHGIIHRDLKPENILISQGQYKLADFGFARTVDNYARQMLNSLVGTPLYMSPQILQQQKYTAKSDIWSLAVIFYEVIFGNTPFVAKSQFQLVQNILKNKITFPSDVECSEKTKNFILGCLKIEESERFDWKDVFGHDLFKDFFKGKIKDKKELEEQAQFVLNDLRQEIYKSKIDIQELFSQYDSSKDNKLQIKEFSSLMKLILGKNNDKEFTRDELEYIFNMFDKNNDGSIDYKEFKDFVSNSIKIKHKKVSKDIGDQEQLATQVISKLKQSIEVHKIDTKKLFVKFDKDQNDCLSENELKSIVLRICPDLTNDQVKTVFQKFDFNHDGDISYIEFCQTIYSV